MDTFLNKGDVFQMQMKQVTVVLHMEVMELAFNATQVFSHQILIVTETKSMDVSQNQETNVKFVDMDLLWSTVYASLQ